MHMTDNIILQPRATNKIGYQVWHLPSRGLLSGETVQGYIGTARKLVLNAAAYRSSDTFCPSAWPHGTCGASCPVSGN